ncbi:hypothetical protein ACIPL1_07825 [Pseudomonas sp. NPDC090202]|uniref:hypothetical protein n=1 Tax=unclassified Pseudomonas TaxID=196821 RepID=UPI0038134175
MSNDPNASFPYAGLREAVRPKGGHLYRVFSLTNHAPMTLFYQEQLLAWSMLEFDPAVVSFEATNRWFDHDSGAIYIAYYVRYIDCDCFLYVPNPSRTMAMQALAKYAKSFSVRLSPLMPEKSPFNETLFWNRVNMLSVLVSVRDKLSSRNLKKFASSIRGSEVSVGELERMSAYSNQEAIAYAFELVRIGYFSISSLGDELLSSSSVLKVTRMVKI